MRRSSGAWCMAMAANTRFAFSYAADATAAFEKECRNYDDFGGSNQLDNDGPPAEPPHRALPSASAGGER
jgi:hypothetical protein